MSRAIGLSMNILFTKCEEELLAFCKDSAVLHRKSVTEDLTAIDHKVYNSPSLGLASPE